MRITFNRAEGVGVSGAPLDVFSFCDMDSLLNMEGRSAPKRGGGYDKCDITVVVGEDSYKFRYDLTDGGSEDYGYPDFRKNLKQRLEFMAGLFRPPHMSEEKYKDFLSWKPERLEEVKALLERLTPTLENHP